MTVKELILVMLGGILVNNYAFEKLLGICPVLGGADKTGKALGTGIATAVVMFVSALITWPVQTLLTNAGIAFLDTFVCVGIILAVVYVLNAIFNKLSGKVLGNYLPLIVLNSAVLGLCLNGMENGSFLACVLAAFGAAVGYLGAMLLFAGVEERIDEHYVPAAFRGLPISLIAAFIISMALVAFK